MCFCKGRVCDENCLALEKFTVLKQSRELEEQMLLQRGGQSEELQALQEKVSACHSARASEWMSRRPLARNASALVVSALECGRTSC